MSDVGHNPADLVDRNSKSSESTFSAETLQLAAAAEINHIAATVRGQVRQQLRRRGIVVGLSGGIDSSVTAALCVAALGPKHVLAVLMPEKDSSSESLRLGRLVAEALKIETVLENIEPILAAAGCYDRRDEFIRRLVPQFGAGWGCKVTLPNVLHNKGYNITTLVVQSPDGTIQKLRMPLDAYHGIIAAANMKQRTRKQIEYYHADRLNYAVAGTPNLLEYDQGFFVKNGDGAADVKPIAHLFKTQVYQLAEHVGLPIEIQRRPPTTDTWSLEQSQEEFYFSLPYQIMDLCLYGFINEIPKLHVATATGLTPDEVDLVWRDIAAKRRATSYLHQPPLFARDISLH